MTYRSKVDAWIFIVIVLVIGISGYATFHLLVNDTISLRWLPITICVGAGIFLPMSLLLGTYYRFDEDYLLIRSGIFKWTISLAEIQSAEEADVWLSSPALSMDRVLIKHKKGEIAISPKQKQAFLDDLNHHIAKRQTE